MTGGSAYLGDVRRQALLLKLWRAQNRQRRFWIHPAALRDPEDAGIHEALGDLWANGFIERKARYLPFTGYQVYYYRIADAGLAAIEAQQA